MAGVKLPKAESPFAGIYRGPRKKKPIMIGAPPFTPSGAGAPIPISRLMPHPPQALPGPFQKYNPAVTEQRNVAKFRPPV